MRRPLTLSLAFAAVIVLIAAGGSTATNWCTVYEPFDNWASVSRRFTVDYCTSNFALRNGQAVMTMPTAECGTRISAKKYFTRGYAEARLRAAPTPVNADRWRSHQGIVTSFILRSDESEASDEIDWEFTGNSPMAQSNYFVNSVLDYTNGAQHSVSPDVAKGYHTYGIEWSPTRIRFSIDGTIVRVVDRLPGRPFPTRPMRVQIGLWNIANDWAGYPDWSRAPFKAYFQHVKFKYPC